MATEQELEECVKKGVEYLDTNEPDWLNRVDCNRLSMEDVDLCILGQIDGNYNNSITSRNIDDYKAVQLGFQAEGTRNKVEYNMLDALWFNAIEKKLSESEQSLQS